MFVGGKRRRDAADEAKSTSDAPRVPSGPVRSLALGDSVTSAATPRCFPTGLLVKGGNVKGAETWSFPLHGSHGDTVRGRSRAQRDLPLLFPVFFQVSTLRVQNKKFCRLRLPFICCYSIKIWSFLLILYEAMTEFSRCNEFWIKAFILFLWLYVKVRPNFFLSVQHTTF